MSTVDATMPERPSGLRVQSADLTLARPPRWAWQDRLPIGYLSLILGVEGIGKSSLAAWIIARLTHGDLPGDLRHKAINVALVGDEDSFAHVWTPRLHAAGADLNRVKALDRPEGGYIELNADKDRLATAIDLEQIEFVFFDSLIDNLGASVNDWHAKDVREALQPPRWIARELDITATGSLHPNKRGSTFRELVAGSSAFNAVSRSSLLLAQHPEDEHRRCLVRGKGNLSAAPPTVEFSIEGYRFDANGHQFNVPRAAGFEVGEITVDELVDTSGAKSTEHSKVAEAAEIIEALLPKDGAWHPAADIYQACETEDIEKRTVQRAMKRLALEHRRASTFQAPSEWRWPTDATPHTSCNSAVASVASVATKAPTTPNNYTHDTHDTNDSDNAGRECVASGNGHRPLNALTADMYDDGCNR
ncbi:MAG TPA: AAA family ATPase [Solirubrobacteraceae bacterium]